MRKEHLARCANAQQMLEELIPENVHRCVNQDVHRKTRHPLPGELGTQRRTSTRAHVQKRKAGPNPERTAKLRQPEVTLEEKARVAMWQQLQNQAHHFAPGPDANAPEVLTAAQRQAQQVAPGQDATAPEVPMEQCLQGARELDPLQALVEAISKGHCLQGAREADPLQALMALTSKMQCPQRDGEPDLLQALVGGVSKGQCLQRAGEQDPIMQILINICSVLGS